MICSFPDCGNTWQLERAHILKTEFTPEGCRETIYCPKCGRPQIVTRPAVEACEDD